MQSSMTGHEALLVIGVVAIFPAGTLLLQSALVYLLLTNEMGAAIFVTVTLCALGCFFLGCMTEIKRSIWSAFFLSFSLSYFLLLPPVLLATFLSLLYL